MYILVKLKQLRHIASLLLNTINSIKFKRMKSSKSTQDDNPNKSGHKLVTLPMDILLLSWEVQISSKLWWCALPQQIEWEPALTVSSFLCVAIFHPRTLNLDFYKPNGWYILGVCEMVLETAGWGCRVWRASPSSTKDRKCCSYRGLEAFLNFHHHYYIFI